MPRPTLFDHPKFHRLVHMLRMPEAHVLGHLEFLWRVGYGSGVALIGDAIDVELAAKWVGEPGVLVKALEDPSVRLLDKDSDGRYAIHDLHDHAPRYVQDRWRKEQERKGRTRGGHAADTRLPVLDTSATPAPAPAPAPAPVKLEDVSPVVMVFPTVGTGLKEWRLRSVQVDEWQVAYPGLDVVAECRRALSWVNANAGHRKTARGMPKFLNAWLGRATDRRGGTGSGPASKSAGNLGALQGFVEGGRH